MDAIRTARLELRTLRPEDVDAAMKFWGDAEIMKHCGGALDRALIENGIKKYTNMQNERGFSVFAVTLPGTNDVIGACGFNYTKDDNEVELIYHFAREYWGSGYATEAAKACIQYAKENLPICKIVASVDPSHESSIKILNKLGFQHAGMKWFDETQQYDVCFELNI